MICFRLLDSDDPATPLAEAVATLRRGEAAESVYAVNPKSFRQVPNAPFAYWVSERIRGLYTELPPFESDGRTAKQGLATANDFRFVRTAWETPEAGTHQAWFPFAKGGSYSPFYADVHLHVNWETNGHELDAFSGSVLRNTDYYFRPGLTWPRRTSSGLSMRVMSSGSVFADKGPASFSDGDSNEYLLSLLAVSLSSPFTALVALQLAAADAAARSYEVGVIQRTVLPDLNDEAQDNLAPLAKSAWSLKRHLDTTNSNSHAFYAPALTPGQCTAPRLAAEPGGTR